ALLCCDNAGTLIQPSPTLVQRFVRATQIVTRYRFGVNRKSGARPSPPPCDASMFGLLDYRDRRHGRLHSPRTERMAEKSPSTPIASSVQTKKKCPPVLASLLVTPTPFPLMWT